MEPHKVAILAFMSGLWRDDLPAHLQQLADEEEFWVQLVDTPEDQLLPEQIEMMQALGAEVPP